MFILSDPAGFRDLALLSAQMISFGIRAGSSTDKMVLKFNYCMICDLSPRLLACDILINVLLLGQFELKNC